MKTGGVYMRKGCVHMVTASPYSYAYYCIFCIFYILFFDKTIYAKYVRYAEYVEYAIICRICILCRNIHWSSFDRVWVIWWRLNGSIPSSWWLSCSRNWIRLSATNTSSCNAYFTYFTYFEYFTYQTYYSYCVLFNIICNIFSVVQATNFGDKSSNHMRLNDAYNV